MISIKTQLMTGLALQAAATSIFVAANMKKKNGDKVVPQEYQPLVESATRVIYATGSVVQMTAKVRLSMDLSSKLYGKLFGGGK